MGGLGEYRRKRDFAVTPEPRGGTRPRGAGLSFVVQKHAATRLHYDFRLELDGVLLSWAVPKGPSLDPADKRLAMQTEDHPIEYANFEGIIPEGEYGGGTVLVWDRGTWEPVEDPRKGVRAGKLKFRLDGEKLLGGWTLVRIRGREARDAGKSWLLMKERDDEARPGSDITAERPESVVSGRSLEDIAEARDRVWRSNRPAAERSAPRHKVARPVASTPPPAEKLADVPGARRAALPDVVEAQLATLVGEAPAGDGWLHEMKFDGYRIIARIDGGRVQLISRNGKDWTERFPAIAQAVKRLGLRTALLDGEVAMVLPNGTTSFNALQNAMTDDGGGALTYFVFDLLHLNGFDLTSSPLEARKRVLRSVLPTTTTPGTLRFSDHVVGGGEQFFQQACRFALEGVISKRRDAPYTPGRSRSWLKIKCIQEQEFVIGGFTDPEGRRSGIGALLLGVHDESGALVYVGKVGTGFTDVLAKQLRRKLEKIETSESPFATRTPGAGKAHWVRPTLVAEVEFTEWTPDGRLRHPSFKGLREDKPARAIVRERPSSVETRSRPSARRRAPAEMRRPARGSAAEVAGVRLTHADRVLYPEQGITKHDLALFYESIADWILPHLKGRPTTLVRCPEGLEEPCFYQKHSGQWAPSVLRRVHIQEKRKVGDYLVVDDLPGLIGLVQMGILEIHTWNSRVDHLEQPDRLVFDLDPGEGVPWAAVIAAARTIRELLRVQRLESFVKTTGGKGFHIVVPIAIGPGWEECADFARAFAEGLERDEPSAFVSTMSKSRRTGRIFIDYLRNLRGATSVAAYSTRARPGAPISTPLTWDELATDVGPDHYTIKTLPRRLASLRSDPWKRYDSVRQKLPGPQPVRRVSARRAR